MRKTFLIIAGSILILFGVFIAVTTTIVTCILPNTYASTVRIVPGVKEPVALATEIEKIKSDPILSAVITNLNLTKIWGEKFKLESPMAPELASAFIKGHVNVRQARNTSLIEITVYDENRTEAAAIANEIATVYQNSPLSTKTADGKPALQIIDKAQPSLRPARPNKSLNIAMGCGVGIIFIGLGIVLMLLSVRRRQPL